MRGIAYLAVGSKAIEKKENLKFEFIIKYFLTIVLLIFFVTTRV
jgi:hypothetical protein